ncbi:MAG: hypothetical protein ACYTAF_17075, partial [Planctomycetota bacterium]
MRVKEAHAVNRSTTGRKMALFLAVLALAAGAGCGIGYRPVPPGPVSWDALAIPDAAEQDLPDLAASPLSLADVLQVAVAGNAGLRAADLRWQAARARPEQVSTLPDPVLTLGRFIDEIVTRNGGI